MTQAQIAKVWFVVGAILLYYALNSWVAAQGGNAIFGAKIVVAGKAPIAMVAIPICSILLAMTALVGRLFALRGGSQWHERIPVVGFETIDSFSREGAIYQGVMLSTFSIVPFAALGYFWYEFLTATVISTDGEKAPLKSVWDWSALKTLNDPARICTDYLSGNPDPCKGNATVLPGLEPGVFAILSMCAGFALVLHWIAVFRSTPKVEGDRREVSSAQGPAGRTSAAP